MKIANTAKVTAAIFLLASSTAQAEHIWTMGITSSMGNLDFYGSDGIRSPDVSTDTLSASINFTTGEGWFDDGEATFSNIRSSFTQVKQTDVATTARFDWLARTYIDTFTEDVFTCKLSGNMQSACDEYTVNNPSYYYLFDEVNTLTDTYRDGSLNTSTGYEFNLGVDQFAIGMFMDASGNTDFPVLSVMQKVETGIDGSGSFYMDVISVDTDGDGVPGTAMNTFPYPGQTIAFSGRLVCQDCPIVSPVPVPAALWLFGSGLLGLVSFARRKKSSFSAA